MIKYILFLSILFLNSMLFGQSRFDVSIMLDKMNIIYTNVDNPITIQTNIPNSDVECTIDNNAILKKSNFGMGMYDIKVENPGDYTITVKQKSTNRQNTYSFRALNLPIPFAKIGNFYKDTISINDLKSQTRLNLKYIPAVDFYIQAEVVSFNVLKISKNGNRVLISNLTSDFSVETKELLNSCNEGDILIFKDILGTTIDTNKQKIGDLIVYID